MQEHNVAGSKPGALFDDVFGCDVGLPVAGIDRPQPRSHARRAHGEHPPRVDVTLGRSEERNRLPGGILDEGAALAILAHEVARR